MLDMHVHVWQHEPGTPVPTREQLEQYCEAAERNGIRQLAITEHSYRFGQVGARVLREWRRPRSGPVAEATEHVLTAESGGDLDAYVHALLEAQDAGLPVLVGLEVDYLPGAMDATSELLGEYPFDVLLGSVHWLDEWLFDAYGTKTFADQWLERDTDAVFSQYVDYVLELAASGAVDVLAHLDVIKVAGYTPKRLAEHEERLVEGLADSNMVIELSSGGLRKPVADTYPSAQLFDALLARGLGITTASDAHVADQIGFEFDRLRAELDARGLDTLTTFTRRRPVTYVR